MHFTRLAPDEYFQRSSLRLGRILQPEGSHYGFSSLAQLKPGSFITYSQYNIKRARGWLPLPATLFCPFLVVVGQGDGAHLIDIIVLVLNGIRHEAPLIRLIQPHTCSNRQLYQCLQGNISENGIISVAEAEMDRLISENERPLRLTRSLLRKRIDTVKLFNGEYLTGRCVESSFLGITVWSLEFEFSVARPECPEVEASCSSGED